MEFLRPRSLPLTARTLTTDGGAQPRPHVRVCMRHRLIIASLPSRFAIVAATRRVARQTRDGVVVDDFNVLQLAAVASVFDS